MKPGDFHQAISKLLGSKLEALELKDKDLNLPVCVEIYTTIFDTLVEVVTQAEAPITNEAMNYLAQQYYDGVLVNGHQELDPDIFTQRAKVENIETKELALLAVMLYSTDFAMPILAEIKKRA